MMIKIGLDDLLGRVWGQMNCGEATVEGLRRQGQIRASQHLPTDIESASRLIAGGGEQWRCVGLEGCLAKPGDIVVSEGPLGWHVSLCTGPRYVLTSSIRHGVHLLALSRVQGVQGVYRWGGEE